MKKKYLFTVLIILFVILQVIPCFASTITKEQLELAIKNGEGTYSKIITDNEITLSGKYKINYDLSNIPTFKINVNIDKKMKWEEYGDEESKWVWFLPIIKAVYECKNVDKEYIQKIGAYFYNEMLNQIKFDDITAYNYEKYNLPKETKNVYGNLNIENEIFTMRTQENIATDEKYNINFVMTINENVDYKKIIDNYKYEEIKEEWDKVHNEILDKAQNGAETYANEVAEQEETIKEALNLIESIKNNEDVEINQIPQTGKTMENIDVLFAILFVSVSVLVLYTIYNRRIDGNK